MRDAFQTALAESINRKVNMRVATSIVAVNRVAEAMRLRGWA